MAQGRRLTADMATYFYVRDDVQICECVVKTTNGGLELYDTVEEMVGEKKNPANGIPYAIEVDNWGELATIGEYYETPEFLVECISEEEYNDFW